MNEMIQKILSRRSIRRYSERRVPRDELEQILQAGLYAPNAGSGQRTLIVVCQNREINEALGHLSCQLMFKDRPRETIHRFVSAEQPSILDDPSIETSFYHAPTVLTLFAQQGYGYMHEDVAMIAENIQLAAHFLGIASCFVGRTQAVFETEYGRETQRQWGVSSDYVALGSVLLGYNAAEAPHAKARKSGRILWAQG